MPDRRRGIDMFELQRLLGQRIGVEINLAYRKIISRAPVGMHLAQFFPGQRLLGFKRFWCGNLGSGSHLCPLIAHEIRAERRLSSHKRLDLRF